MIEILQALVIVFGGTLVLEMFRYNKAIVAAWWYQQLHAELRDAAPWADPRKVKRVYREEIR